MESKSIWTKYSDGQLRELEALNKGYMDFMSECKTERECVDRIIEDAEAAGYRNLDELIRKRAKLTAGDKVYRSNMGKSILLFNIGEDPIQNGMNILGAHIDSPRLDVKQNPLYEDGDFAYLDTHYYGGIKKYQYVTIPMAIHGVFVKKDGTKVKVAIGEDPGDPVFFISDLLAHLADEQMTKKASKVIEGEALDLIVGNRPIKLDEEKEEAEEEAESAVSKMGEIDENKVEKVAEKAEQEVKDAAKNPVKQFALDILKEKYGVEEEDFISAELEIVPAGRAREAGFDKSMILAYGQDDRVCAYTSYQAMLGVGGVKRTACCIFVDKEEIGSMGATGMESRFFENTVAELIALMGQDKSPLVLRRALANSSMLSSDVSSAFDPLYPSAFEKKNSSFMGRGLVITKYTGIGGKYEANDANAEFIAHVRNIFDKEGISFQTAELGKVDLGGGGTIAYILALYGMNVVDSGVPVLSMHSPWEATSKADVYEACRGYVAFLKNADRL